MDELDTLYQRAFDAYRAGQMGAAEQRLDELLDRSPTDARAMLLKSVVHTKAEPAVCLAMVEQAVHVWDVFHWVAGGLPSRAYGSGRRDVFTREQPGRDMTDDYQASLRWEDGFAVNFVQSWAAPADDGFTGLEVSGVVHVKRAAARQGKTDAAQNARDGIRRAGQRHDISRRNET